MKIPQFIRANLLLKMTSLNAVVVSIRLAIAFVMQRVMYEFIGAEGLYKVGQLRSLEQLLTSVTSLGVFNGVVKYLAEYKEDKPQLQKLFSSVFVFSVVGVTAAALGLFFGAGFLSEYLFASSDFTFLLKFLAVLTPAIALQRIFDGVVNGLSQYKQYAKIQFISYILSTVLTLVALYFYNLEGVLLAIAFVPVIQLGMVIIVFSKVLKEYIEFKKLSFKSPMAKSLLAFTLMSFVSSILLPIVEIDLRSMIAEQISEIDAGVWTNVTVLSKNYMVFSGAMFTLYVLPKFASIHAGSEFKKEVFNIYKTLLPVFGVGMLLIYLFRNVLIDLLYPGLNEMAPLFKWQLMGDFIRLACLVLTHQFLAKKMVRNYIFSEIFSIGLFFGLSYYLVQFYQVEGIVMAHFIRYVLYFVLVVFLIWRYFNNRRNKNLKTHRDSSN
jgi:O-antigen/teichoic acid export membrane protein